MTRLIRPAEIADAANTLRGSYRSASPRIAEIIAPATKPIWTPLDIAACRTGESVTSRSISGSVAAETNQRLITATSATISSEMERNLSLEAMKFHSSGIRRGGERSRDISASRHLI